MSTMIDELLLSAAEVEIQATGKPTTVSIVAYTGGLMTVPGWGPVAIDLAGVDASADQIGILADHRDEAGTQRLDLGEQSIEGAQLQVAVGGPVSTEERYYDRTASQNACQGKASAAAIGQLEGRKWITDPQGIIGPPGTLQTGKGELHRLADIRRKMGCAPGALCREFGL